MTTNRRALHERIAETLEPKDAAFNWPNDPTSPKGVWIREMYDGGKRRWHAANFDTDEAANALLRNAMLVESDTPELLSLRQEDRWMTIQRDIYRRLLRRFDEGSDIAALYREAVVDQFVKWKKLEIPSGGTNG